MSVKTLNFFKKYSNVDTIALLIYLVFNKIVTQFYIFIYRCKHRLGFFGPIGPYLIKAEFEGRGTSNEEVCNTHDSSHRIRHDGDGGNGGGTDHITFCRSAAHRASLHKDDARFRERDRAEDEGPRQNHSISRKPARQL